jgi:hypothetical protein
MIFPRMNRIFFIEGLKGCSVDAAVRFNDSTVHRFNSAR